MSADLEARFELLHRYRTIAREIHADADDAWVAAVESFRLAGNLRPAEEATLHALEQQAGGYWVDAPSMDLGTHTITDTRFIHRDMCVKCCSLRRDHLDTGTSLQCLFAPSTFEETKP